jgi:hypothetical protein
VERCFKGGTVEIGGKRKYGLILSRVGAKGGKGKENGGDEY